MSRKPSNSSRRPPGSGSKSRTSPLLSLVLIIVGLFMVIGYFRGGSGISGGIKAAISKLEGESCTSEVQKAFPLLKETYGDSMRRVLHVGPDTCSVVSKLLREEDAEAWGVEPYDMEDADDNCKTLIRRGIVREADIKFPLPYRAKSFSLVLVSDALDYLSPKYMNKTVPDLVRVSTDGLVIFTGYPSKHRAKLAELPKFGRPAKMRSASWWTRFFAQANLEVNEDAAKKFDQAAMKVPQKPSCQVFHLSSNHR
ncbi:hypothetical protein NMG60_11028700 [Bertholletia excelsa]